MSDVQAQLVVVFTAIIGLAVVIVRVVGPIVDARIETFLKREVAAIEAKLPANVVAAINAAAIFGAQAAEQMALGQHIANTIDSKKAYAIAAADRWLKAQGYNVDLTTLGDAIETVILQGLHLPQPSETPQTLQAGNHPANNLPPPAPPSPDKTQQIPTPAAG